MTPDERALMHTQERHDAELEADAIFSHVEHQEPIRAAVDATARFIPPETFAGTDWDAFEDEEEEWA